MSTVEVLAVTVAAVLHCCNEVRNVEVSDMVGVVVTDDEEVGADTVTSGWLDSSDGRILWLFGCFSVGSVGVVFGGSAVG
jgi:hypothetical protein